jgi:hypothetical protein
MAEGERNIRTAIELDQNDKRLVVDLATILEWKNPGEHYGIRLAWRSRSSCWSASPAICLVAERQNIFRRACLNCPVRRSAGLLFPLGGCWIRSSLRIAAVTASALREAEGLFPAKQNRRANLQTAGRTLMGVGECSNTSP